MRVLEIKDIYKSFDDLRVLNGISLDVDEGEGQSRRDEEVKDKRDDVFGPESLLLWDVEEERDDDRNQRNSDKR